MIVYVVQSATGWMRNKILRLLQGDAPHSSAHAVDTALAVATTRTGPQVLSTPDRRWQTAPESRIVEERYRLLPADVGHTGRRVRIQNVSYQGVENLRLVLHFAETRKALALNQIQCRDLIRSMGSGHIEDWLDRSVLLRVDATDGIGIIRIYSTNTP